LLLELFVCYIAIKLAVYKLNKHTYLHGTFSIKSLTLYFLTHSKVNL